MGRLGKVRENSNLNTRSIKINSNTRQEICKKLSEWARNIWGTHPEKQKTLDNGEFFEAISNIKLQLHLETHTRIWPEREVVTARCNNGKANYNKSMSKSTQQRQRIGDGNDLRER